MANPLLTPDGKHPKLGSSPTPPPPRDFTAATDDFETCPQPFGRTLSVGDGDSYVAGDENTEY